MIANESTIHQILNEVDVSNYKPQYGLLQWGKIKTVKSAIKYPEITNVKQLF